MPRRKNAALRTFGLSSGMVNQQIPRVSQWKHIKPNVEKQTEQPELKVSIQGSSGAKKIK